MNKTIEEHICMLKRHINTSGEMGKHGTNLTLRDIRDLFDHTEESEREEEAMEETGEKEVAGELGMQGEQEEV